MTADPGGIEALAPSLPPLRQKRSRARWIVVAIGGFFLTDLFGALGVLLGLTLHWPSRWEDFVWALLALSISSVIAATVVVGLITRLRGPREWLAGLVLVVATVVGPGAVITALLSLANQH